MIVAADVVDQARLWLGTPFQHQGRAAHGIDCVGLVIEVGKALGVLAWDYDYSVYPRTPQPGVMLAELGRFCDRADRAAPGMIAVCQWGADPQHVAFVGDGRYGLTLIHALQDQGKVLEHRYDKIWLMTTKHIFALKGVDYGR